MKQIVVILIIVFTPGSLVSSVKAQFRLSERCACYVNETKINSQIHDRNFVIPLNTSLDLKPSFAQNQSVSGFDYEIKQRRIIAGLIIALLLISVLSLWLLYYLRLNRRYKNAFKEKNKKLSHKNTMLLKSEKELKELNDSKNKLFSVIAHDIKSPLYAMIRMADVLIDKYDLHDDEKRKNYITLLNQSGKELVNLIENLLSWSRYQVGNIPFRPSYFPFIESLNFAMGVSQHLATQKGIKIKIDVPSPPVVFADFSITSTVIRNIVSNAVKFTSKGGEINIVLEDSLDYVKIEISDNGIGIPLELIENIFKLEKSATRAGTLGEKGSGLGLALCKEFVEKNGGQIGVRSVVDKGSTFWFTLRKQKF